MEIPEGSSIIAYADDTLILVAANSIERLINKSNSLVQRVVDRINGMGLQIAEQKTEIVLFGLREVQYAGAPLGVRVGTSEVRIQRSMKYLGLFIDGRWSFRRHFVYIEDKVLKVSRALGRLMPNLRGPSENKKRLYYNVLLSVVMYGAPIWDDVMASRWRDLAALRRVQKEMALREICGYRIVAFDAALLLTRVPPSFMVATMLKRSFERLRELRLTGEWSREVHNNLKKEERRRLRRRWSAHVSGLKGYGLRTRLAVTPSFELWLDRAHGNLIFHSTQILTGHGCFGTFLSRIGRVGSPVCEHCTSGEVDNAEHTLRFCTAWEPERAELYRVFGGFLTLPTIIEGISRSGDAWRTFAHFASVVMRIKEEAERRRQMDLLPSSLPPSPGNELRADVLNIVLANS